MSAPIVLSNPKGLMAAIAPGGAAAPRDDADFAAIRRLSQALIGGETASLDTLRAAHERTGQAFFCLGHGESMRAFTGMLPMNAYALPYLWMGQFNSLNPDLELLARPGERIAAWWFWGIVSVDHDAARDAVKALLMTRPYVRPLPKFARSTTPAGRRISIDRMGFVPMRFPDDALLFCPPKSLDDELDQAA